MSLRPLLTRATCVAAILATGWILAPARGEAATAFHPVSGAASYFAASAPELWSSSLPAGNRMALPASTRNNPGQRCSVELANPAPQPCSSNGSGVAKACSALADQGHACSAFGLAGNPAGSGGACSTKAANNALCSVGQPAGGNLPSDCSAYGGPAQTTARCSTIVANTTNQFCSADNKGTQGNRCSAVASMGGSGQCSVLERSTTNKCSVNGAPAGGAAPDRCSTFVGNGSFCSITQTGTGARCTAFNGAIQNQCSAHVGNSHCSVQGGPGPVGGICQ